MTLKRGRRFWQKIALSWFTIGALCAIVTVLSFAVFDMYKKNRLATEKMLSAKGELTKIESRKDSLAKDLKRIKTGKGIEERLREKFDVGKKGERLLIIIDKEIQHETVQEQPFWTRVWQKIRRSEY